MSGPVTARRGRVTAAAALIICAIAPAAAGAQPTLDANPASGLGAGSTLTTSLKAPIQSVGLTTQLLSTRWNPAQAVLTGAVTAPTGWTPEYTVDGTSWSTTLPADPTTVTGVRAGGSVASDGVSGGRQVRTTDSTGAVTPTPTFAGGGVGDGWDAFTSEDYVLNAYHHQSFVLACHIKTTGDDCPTATYSDGSMGTGSVSNGVVINNKAYVPVSKGVWVGYNKIVAGLACVDLSSPTFQDCGFKTILDPGGGGNQTLAPTTLSVSGTKIFVGVPFQAGGAPPTTWKLACFDTATGTDCPGAPYTAPSSDNTVIGYGTGFTTAFDGKVFLTAGKVWCFNAADGSQCNGGTGWPVTGITMGNGPGGATAIHPFIPMRNGSGAAIGGCIPYNGAVTPFCVDYTGQPLSVPPGLTALLASKPMGGVVAQGSSQYDFAGTRQYWAYSIPYGNTYPVCYDWTTDAACAGFATDGVLSAGTYGITTDRYDPACVWSNGHSGTITQFSATAGGSSCAGGPLVSVASSAMFPRLACEPGGTIKEMETITVNAPVGVDRTQFKVTVRDSSGNAIPGYTNLNPNSSGVVDVSGLSPSVSGQSPTVDIRAVGATNAQGASISAEVKYVTDYPELCVPLETKNPCPQLSPGVGNGPDVDSTPISLDGVVDETPYGGSTSSSNASASASRSAVSGCVGSVSGTARYTDGKPVAAKTVTLRAPDGSVLATTTTDASGRYAFPYVHPHSAYSVRFESESKDAGVTAQTETVVDFRLPLPTPSSTFTAKVTSPSNVVPVVTVVVPGPGKISQKGTSSKLTVCTGVAVARKAGRYRVPCRLTQAGRRAIRQRSLRVRFAVTYRPRGGKARTVYRTAVLRKRSPSFTG